MPLVCLQVVIVVFPDHTFYFSKAFKLYDTDTNQSLSRHILLVDNLNDTATMSIIAVSHTLNLFGKEAYLSRESGNHNNYRLLCRLLKCLETSLSNSVDSN